MLLAALGCVALAGHAEPPEEVRFDHLSLEEGLAQATVYGIAQTPEGLVWLATESGLHYFDGYRFHRAGGDVLKRRAVMLLHQGRNGVLWVATFTGGLYRYSAADGSVIELRQGCLAAGTVHALWEDRRGVLWAACHDGSLLTLEAATGQPLSAGRRPSPRALGAAEAGVTALLEDRHGTLWVGTATGELRALAAGRGGERREESVRSQGFRASSAITAVIEDQDAAFWIATETTGIWRWRPDGGSSEAEPVPGLEAVRARSLLADRDGTVWAGSPRGLFAVTGPPWRARAFRRDPLNPDSLRDDNIRSLFEDRAGLLWIGTAGGGVERYDSSQHRFHRLRHLPGDEASLSHDFVWTVIQDLQGTLWVGTGGGGLNRLDAESARFRHYRHDSQDPSTLGSDHVTALLSDHRGALWVGTDGGGLSRLDPATDGFVHYRHRPDDATSLPVGAVSALLEDSRGEIWVAMGGGGLSHLPQPATGRFEHHRACGGSAAAPPQCYVMDLAEDRDGVLWLVVYGHGLMALSATDRQPVATLGPRPGGLPDDQVVAIRAAGDGTFWLGGVSGWIARLDPGRRTVSPVTWQQDSEEVSIYSLLEDGAGDLWVGTNRGLWRYEVETGKSRRYDPRDGLQGYEFNAHAAFRNPATGELFMGGLGGLNRFHPERIVDHPLPPPVILTAISTLEGELASGAAAARLTTLELDHRHRLLAFDFAALDYRNPAKNRFAYRLEGQDDDWVYAGDRHHASYTNLAGGRYVFRVRGSNGDGVWNQQGSALTLRIHPPFWQTWWLRGGLAVLVLGVAAGTPALWLRRRLRRAESRRKEELEQRRRLLAARDDERGRLARELHDGPLQDLHALRLQWGQTVAGSAPRLAIVIHELRRLCGELRPLALASSGLAPALRSHAQRFAEAHPRLELRLDLRDEGTDLPPASCLHLYRICQEALSNAAQHSGGSRVEVRFERDAEGCVLTVRDDGHGFAVPRRWIDLPVGAHYGLLGIAERVEALHGSFTVRSSPDDGTEVRVEVPSP